MKHSVVSFRNLIRTRNVYSLSKIKSGGNMQQKQNYREFNSVNIYMNLGMDCCLEAREQLHLTGSK
jgi:hypothetical protein